MAAGILFELRAQRGHDVKGGMHARKFLEHAYHAPVVLESMQPGPGQHIAAGGRVAVLRLMHMPENDQMNSVHIRSVPKHGAGSVLE